jgi:cobalamin synthase
MGWFFVNIVLPIGVPLIFLFIAKSVDLPEPYASRAKLIRAVRDGQLGWVAIVFAAATVYELLRQLREIDEPPVWAGLVFAISCVFLAISGFMATLGTLFPVEESKVNPVGAAAWVRHYRLFVASVVATVITAALFSLAHFALAARCDCAVPTGKETSNESASKIFTE